VKNSKIIIIFDQIFWPSDRRLSSSSKKFCKKIYILLTKQQRITKLNNLIKRYRTHYQIGKEKLSYDILSFRICLSLVNKLFTLSRKYKKCIEFITVYQFVVQIRVYLFVPGIQW